MSIPHSKILNSRKAGTLSASKSIMAMAKLQSGINHNKFSNEQSQTDNINLQQPTPTQPTVTRDVQYPTPYEIEEGITVVPPTIPTQLRCGSDAPAATPTTTEEAKQRDIDTAYAELGELHRLLNNSENVAKALILIIDLMMSNPLMVNKLIVPTYESFRELICTLTCADDVDIQYNEDVSCTVSKKYHLIEDIYIVKAGETQSLKYTYPEVLRLFDRFKISSKMIAV
jgi:hypothetical protein